MKIGRNERCICGSTKQIKKLKAKDSEELRDWYPNFDKEQFEVVEITRPKKFKECCYLNSALAVLPYLSSQIRQDYEKMGYIDRVREKEQNEANTK